MSFPYSVYDGHNRIIDFEYNDATLSDVEVDNEVIIYKRSDDNDEHSKSIYKHENATCLIIVCAKWVPTDEDGYWDGCKHLHFLSTKDGIFKIEQFHSEKDLLYFEKHAIVLEWNNGHFPNFSEMSTSFKVGDREYQS